MINAVTVAGRFELMTLSPASAKVSAISALNICLGFFNAEYAEEDAEFAEKSSKQQVISKYPLPAFTIYS